MKSNQKRKNKNLHKKITKSPILILWRCLLYCLLPLRWGLGLSSSLHWLLRYPIALCYSALFYGIALLIIYYCVYYPRAKIYQINNLRIMESASIVYAADKKTILGKISTKNRILINIKDIPPYFIEALLCREDQNFYQHHGISLKGLLRIPYHYLRYRKKEGASTITMQLARNSFLLSKNTIDRKLLEIMVALRIEGTLTKKQILEAYVNRIFWGHSCQGVGAAAAYYFNKSPQQLTLAESALMVAIIRGPNLLSPYRNLSQAIKERNRLLSRMLEQKKITPQQYDIASKAQVKLQKHRQLYQAESYPIKLVQQEIENLLSEKQKSIGGLKIYTSIQAKLQTKMQQKFEQYLQKIEHNKRYSHLTRRQWLQQKQRFTTPPYLQGALVAIDNYSGKIVCAIGGRNAKESVINRISNHQRPQVSSIIKPFIYLAALDKGWRKSRHIPDTQVKTNWPKNYDHIYYRLVPLYKALAESRNCATVHIAQFAGKAAILALLRQLKLYSYQINDASAYLGSSNESLLNLTAAYTIFPNGGNRWRPHIITSIQSNNKQIYYQKKYQHIASRQHCATISRALGKVMTQGTAAKTIKKYKFRRKCGGKTGTSNRVQDAWFIGYTKELTCGVWVGFDTPKTILKGESGASLALPIWINFMRTFYQQKK